MNVKSDCPVVLGLWGSSGSSGLSKVQFHHRCAAQARAWAWCGEPHVWAGPGALETPLSHSPLPPKLPLHAPPESSPSRLLPEPQSHSDKCLSILLAKRMRSIDREILPSLFPCHERRVSVSYPIACSFIPSRPPVGILPSVQETASHPSCKTTSG